MDDVQNIGLTHMDENHDFVQLYNATSNNETGNEHLNESIKHRRTTTYFVIFKVNTLCTFFFSSILYTNRLLVYPSAREALAKKINISCVWVY